MEFENQVAIATGAAAGMGFASPKIGRNLADTWSCAT